jgi:hypothetical protein
MSLIDRSRAFAESAKQLDGYKKATTLVTAVGSRANQLENALGKLRLAGGQLAFLRERGVKVAADVSSSTGFSHHLGELQTATADDPSAVTASEVQIKTLTPLNTFSQTISDACDTAWKQHVAAVLPRVGADLVAVLGQVPALRVRVERFRTLLAAAHAKAHAPPTSLGDFEAFEGAASACHEAWTALDADDIPAHVTRFLRDATSDAGASLESLSDGAVADWLKAQGLDRSFVIRAL